jgi:hypothetical protein
MEVSGQLHSPAGSPPGETVLGTHCIRCWVVQRTGLELLEENLLALLWIETRPSSSYLVAIRTKLSRHQYGHQNMIKHVSHSKKKVKKKNLNNAVFWDVAPCRSCELNRRFGGTSVQFTRSTRRHILEDDIILETCSLRRAYWILQFKFVSLLFYL